MDAAVNGLGLAIVVLSDTGSSKAVYGGRVKSPITFWWRIKTNDTEVPGHNDQRPLLLLTV